MIRTWPYQQGDLKDLAKDQLALEESCSGLEVPYLFIDTSMLVLKIWSEYRYGGVDDFILKNFEARDYDLCLLCEPVEPYVADDLRENPHDRWSLYYLYLKELFQNAKKPQIIRGNLDQRLQLAKSMIGQLV